MRAQGGATGEGGKASWKKGTWSSASTVTLSLHVDEYSCLSYFSPCPGENVAADGSLDLSKLEVSLTLTNKFEGLETDSDGTSARSLLLR